MNGSVPAMLLPITGHCVKHEKSCTILGEIPSIVGRGTAVRRSALLHRGIQRLDAVNWQGDRVRKKWRCQMSFLDRVTKAVGEAVDRGKKEVDQFVRIQKINGQIGDCEKKIGESKAQIQQAKLEIGEKAVEMLRAGTLASPEMLALLERITGFDQQIAAEEAAIAEKRAEIEKIKAEEKSEKAPGAASPEPQAAMPPAADAGPPTPPAGPVGTVPGRFCPQCGTPVGGGGAFCAHCGAKLA